MITNQLNLPQPLVLAVTPQPRERVAKRISITELSNPPQQRALKIQHEGELTEDASDRIFALLGQLLHGVLEGYAKDLDDIVAEEKLTMQILDYTVVGKYDLSEMILDGELLTDYKLCSLYSVRDGVKKEFEEQLNCYAELLRQNGRHVSQLQIVAVMRDWSRNKARFERDYPKQQVKVMAVPLWTSEQAKEFLEERVTLHRNAEAGDHAECTSEERWARPTQWALMKTGQKRAVKLYDTKHAAEWALAKNQYIQERPGASIRCEAYCAASTFCKQWYKLQHAEAEDKDPNLP